MIWDINCVKEKSLNSFGAKKSKAGSPKNLLNKELNKNIDKLCSEADMRIKVLLSKTSASTSSSKLSSFNFDSTSKPSSPIILPPIVKKVSINFSEQSNLKHTVSKQKRSPDLDSGSHHFNTEIDIGEGISKKQQAVIKIIRLRNLAHKMEERQNFVIKNRSESSVFQKSYTNGLEEGFRYGYFVNPNVKLNTKSDLTKDSRDTTYDDLDRNIFRSTEIQLIENKESESERMRGGYQDPHGAHKKRDHSISSANKSESTMDISTSLEEKPSKLTIIHEYPNKCTEEINVQEFNEKFAIENKDIDKFDKLGKSKVSVKIGLSTITLTDIDKGGEYLQYFEKMLKSVGSEFATGFRAGFGDGFVAANVFIPADTTFYEDEKEYIGQLRKILKFSDDDIRYDIKKIYARADQMKQRFNITPDDLEKITYLTEKEIIKKYALEFSKNDYEYYKYGNKKVRKQNRSMYEDSELIYSCYEPETVYIPQHTKNRAINYLTKHKINEFFQFLGSHLIASKPDDPISFLIEMLDKCIEYRFNEYVMQAPLLFTKKHIESVYYVLDPLLTGYINLGQYVHGMKALGIINMGNLSYFRPGEKIDKYIFITNASQHLLRSFREMIAMDSVTAIPSKAAYTTVESK